MADQDVDETTTKKPARCPGRKGKSCSSFVRVTSPHAHCRKCRRCNKDALCDKCAHFGPEHWAELVQRGKHGSRGSTSSCKSHIPVRKDKTAASVVTSLTKVKEAKVSKALDTNYDWWCET